MNKLIATIAACTVCSVHKRTNLVVVEVVGIGDDRHDGKVVVAGVIYISMCSHIAGKESILVESETVNVVLFPIDAENTVLTGCTINQIRCGAICRIAKRSSFGYGDMDVKIRSVNGSRAVNYRSCQLYFSKDAALV